MKSQLQEYGAVTKQASLLESRKLAWVCVGIMLLCVLISLPITPILWRFMVNTFGQRFNSIAYAASILLIIGFAVYMIRHRERFGISHYLLLGGLALFYFYLLKYQCHFPAERFHLIEYGLLAYLTFRALRFDFPRTMAYGLAFLLTSAFGILDEGIQYLLPNRVCEFRDMMTNVIASGLGLVVVSVLFRKDACDAPSREVSK